MADFIVIAILLICVGAAAMYIIKEKKKGTRCIGCPAAGECSRKHSEASGCSCGSAGESSCGCHTDIKA